MHEVTKERASMKKGKSQAKKPTVATPKAVKASAPVKKQAKMAHRPKP
jgi:hypothetical protein